MSERTVMLMAFRGDGEGYGGSGWRDRAYTSVMDYLKDIPWPLYQADSGHKPFNISHTYNQAAADAGDWDKAIIHPPDVFTPLEQIHQAVEAADGGLVHAFTHFTRLNRQDTEAFYAGRREFPGQRYQGGFPPMVVPRWLWDEVRGFHTGLKGHGAEDGIFWHMCRVLGNYYKRIPGPMYAMWHPRYEEAQTAEEKEFYSHLDANRSVRAEVLAIKDPDKMREYIAKVHS